MNTVSKLLTLLFYIYIYNSNQHITIIEQTAKLVKQNNYVLETKFHELSKEINILTSSSSANTKAIAVNELIDFFILGMLKYQRK